ncbi:hypothetical protein DYB28_003457 [Aphanomyces astaci]|uniref:ALA-interacting subunit n=2 Tax=Aphanomyces astaci TaxID=112090 RepID=A0A9X8E3I9_APHAT|nr:hypothetical protein DYB28_003457 [Aphanomyces astaci]
MVHPYTPFKQQKLKAWQPILTPAWVIATYFLVGLIFLPIGVVLYQQNLDVVEMAIQYDGVDASTGLSTLGASLQNLSPTSSCSLPNDSDGNSFNLNEHGCVVSFKLQNDMKAPIMVYYQLDNFYQNHRRYVQSRNDAQLRGQPVSLPISTCDGATQTTDFNVSLPSGEYLNQTQMYGNVTVVNLMDQSDLAWKSDLDTKFNNYDTVDANDLYLWQNQKYRWVIPSKVGQEPIINKTAWTKPTTSYGAETERFVLWMRTAGLPNFRKKYGRINTDLPKGTVIRFLVSSNFPVQSFDGRKSLVISTLSWYGGQNAFLGLAYIVVGGICMLLSLFFFIKHKLSPRKLGDTNYLVWRGNKPN